SARPEARDNFQPPSLTNVIRSVVGVSFGPDASTVAGASPGPTGTISDARKLNAKWPHHTADWDSRSAVRQHTTPTPPSIRSAFSRNGTFGLPRPLSTA